MQSTAGLTRLRSSDLRQMQPVLPRSGSERGEFRNSMADAHVWMPAWTDEDEGMLVRVEEFRRKSKGQHVGWIAQEQTFRALETSLHQVWRRTTHCRQLPVLSVTVREKPTDSQEKWSILKSNNRQEEQVYACVSVPQEMSKTPLRSLPRKEESEKRHRTTVSSDTSSFLEKSISKRKEADIFEFEPWPRASKFGSRKISLRRQVMSGSSHPMLVGDRLAEMDCATSTDDWDHFRICILQQSNGIRDTGV